MNFYREWKRWYVDFSFSAGRYPKPGPEEIGWRTALDNLGRDIGETVDTAILDNAYIRAELGDEFVAAAMGAMCTGTGAIKVTHIPTADLYAHIYQDPDALQGNITTPAGAQDFTVVPQEGGGGWGVVDVTRAAYVPNPVNQRDEE